MKTKLVIGIASIIVVSLTITLVLVYVPILPEPEVHEYFPPSDRFTSRIIRDVPDASYLSLLNSFENLTGQAIYFDMLQNESKSFIHNISDDIEEELIFLDTYDPLDFKENTWRHHNFTYVGSVILEVDKSSFLSMFNLTSLYPYFIFYYNTTSAGYNSNSTMYTGYNSADWMLPNIVDYSFGQNTTFTLVTQFMVISDIYAPLAGTGTSFERQILTLATGQPVLFFSNEGPWWIS